MMISCISSFSEESTSFPEILQLDGLTQLVPPEQDFGIGRLYWSPDSTQIVFLFAKTSNSLLRPSKYQIHTIDILSAETKLIEDSENPRDIRGWLPDNRIAFYASGDLQEGIWFRNLAKNKTDEYFMDSWQIIWSPIGQNIAFEKFEKGSQINLLSILVRNLINGKEQEVFKAERKSNSLNLLQWSPDGISLLFTLDNVSNTGDDIYLLTMPSMEITKLTNDGYHVAATWSTTGELIAFTKRNILSIDEPVMLYLMKADGSCSMKILPQSDYDVGWATWSPDGRWIAFTWNKGLYLLDTKKVLGEEYEKFYAMCP